MVWAKLEEDKDIQIFTFSHIQCGKNHTMLLSSDGRVFCCGRDLMGQVGHNGDRRGPPLFCFPSLKPPQKPGCVWELVPVNITKRIYDISACGDQSFAVEGLSSSRLGSTLWQTYQKMMKRKDVKAFDLVLVVGDPKSKKKGGGKGGTQNIYAHRSVLCSRIRAFQAILEQAATLSKSKQSESKTEEGDDEDLGGLGKF